MEKVALMNLPVNGSELVDLIPQKPPFVLIDTLESVTESSCCTSFTIPANHVLCKDGTLGAAGLIENIAQTCAAKAGYEYALAGKNIPVGFIGDVRHFQCTVRPQANQKICTTINIEHKVFGATIIEGKVELDGKKIAACKMKVFENEAADAAESHAEKYA